MSLVSSLTTLLTLSATTRSVAGRPLGLFTLSTVAASESRQPRGSLLHRIGAGDRSRGEQLRAVTALTGEGDWPAGMLSHSAGATPSGWMVVEVWEARRRRRSSCSHGSAPHWDKPASNRRRRAPIGPRCTPTTPRSGEPQLRADRSAEPS